MGEAKKRVKGRNKTKEQGRIYRRRRVESYAMTLMEWKGRVRRRITILKSVMSRAVFAGTASVV
jgi:hypothetical protein